MSSTGAWGILEIEAFTSRVREMNRRKIHVSVHVLIRSNREIESIYIATIKEAKEEQKRGQEGRVESGGTEQRQKEVGIRRNGERENTER